MAWTKRQNSANQVNKAGDVVSDRTALSDMSKDTALDIAGNWRSSHGYPLHVMWLSLTNRAKQIDPKALTAKRTKRMPSIVAKLKRFDGMQLSRIEDLGGCRAIVETVDKVDELVALYEAKPQGAATLRRKRDYIAGPKDDGYRSVHLIYEYQGNSQGGAFKGLKIEIQIRSALQHAWATAVETIDAFTGQGLKSHIGQQPWMRFFLLVSYVMALYEKRPVPAGVPADLLEMLAEVRSLCHQLNIPNVFAGLSTGIQGIEKKLLQDAEAYILMLDSQEKMTRIIAFPHRKEAEQQLLQFEKENIEKPHIQTVLASANSVKGLRQAYPNYYADTSKFIGLVNSLLKGPQKKENKTDK